MSDTVTTEAGTGVQERAGAAAETAREQASEVAGTAKEQVSEVAGAAKEQARAVAGDVREQTRRLVADSREQLRDQAGEQTRRAAGSVRELGDQLQRMAAGEGAPEGPVGDLAHQAAGAVQRLADSLEQRRPEELLDDVKRFARQRPGLFVLGALGAGFAVGRLLRTADTSSLTDAAKSAMSGDEGDGSAGRSGPEQGREPERIGGPGSLSSGATGAGAAAMITAEELDAGDSLAAGMAGTTPADLVEGAAGVHPPRAEPLRASPLDVGFDTGSEA